MESALSKIDTTVLDNIIVGRVEPYIYAFSTETVPNYLKSWRYFARCSCAPG